jgi:hypothetical protein
MGTLHCFAARLLRASVMLAAVVLWAGTAQAASQGGTGKVVIVRPNVFINVQDLDFGTILPSGTAGTVTVPTSGPRTATGGATIIPGSAFGPARFAGEGTGGQRVLVNIVGSSATLTRVGGTQTMTVNNLVLGFSPSFTAGAGPNTYFIASPTGIFNFPVGGTLQVGANQAEGNYVGTFRVNLVYQ